MRVIVARHETRLGSLDGNIVWVDAGRGLQISEVTSVHADIEQNILHAVTALYEAMHWSIPVFKLFSLEHFGSTSIGIVIHRETAN